MPRVVGEYARCRSVKTMATLLFISPAPSFQPIPQSGVRACIRSPLLRETPTTLSDLVRASSRMRSVIIRAVVDNLDQHEVQSGILRQHTLHHLMQKPRAVKCGNHHRPERSMHTFRDRRKLYPVVAIGYHLFSIPFGGQDALKNLINLRAWETASISSSPEAPKPCSTRPSSQRGSCRAASQQYARNSRGLCRACCRCSLREQR